MQQQNSKYKLDRHT